jgi:hypothetical protein
VRRAKRFSAYLDVDMAGSPEFVRFLHDGDGYTLEAQHDGAAAVPGPLPAVGRSRPSRALGRGNARHAGTSWGPRALT